jgi:hypothetical protein
VCPSHCTLGNGAHLRPDRCVGEWVSCRVSVDVAESRLMCYGIGNGTLTSCFNRTYCSNDLLRLLSVKREVRETGLVNVD